MGFVHLHVHTEFSMLDGASSSASLAATAKSHGSPAVAITDHGNMHGALEFFRACRAADIKPIIGMEAYVSPGSRADVEPMRWGTPEQRGSDVSGGGKYTHMTLLASSHEGYKNLSRLSSESFASGMAGKHGRIDAELLQGLSRGLIGTTGCLGGEVATRLALGQYSEAVEAAAKWRDILGPQNYFLEIMEHGLEHEQALRSDMIRLAKHLGLRPLVTNDSHFTAPGDALMHDALLCLQTGAQLADEGRFRFAGSGYHLRTPQEMRGLDSSDFWSEGCDNTLLVADQVDISGMFEYGNHMPAFETEPGVSDVDELRNQAFAGLARLQLSSSGEHIERLDYELRMISRMGFSSYFLIVGDLVGWAKAQGISVGPGRGSAAGCLVSYVLGITGLDPLEHGLLFERFLNPERVSMPDIDIDFDDRRRLEVMRYVEDRYGHEHVAQIATFGRVKGRTGLRDAGRVLGVPFGDTDELTKAYPADVMGSSMLLSEIVDPRAMRYEEAAPLRGLLASRSELQPVFDLALKLEGSVRQTGVHAAGIIVSAGPVADVVPTFRRAADPAAITQFSYPECESLGLLKMDFLGLRNLTVIADAMDAIGGDLEELRAASLDLSDSATLALLASGYTTGVFQLDSQAMQALIKTLVPKGFEDIIAILALYRPGPMGVGAHTAYARRSNGLESPEAIHPEVAEAFAPILGATHGLVVYQEQVQECARIMAGYSLGQADLLRRAMGKKSAEALAKEWPTFEGGARERGYSLEATKAVWDTLIPFAGYAFNKSHAAAYGMLTWQTAWLKAHHPEKYMAALLSSLSDEKIKLAAISTECKRMGIAIRPPSFRTSVGSFSSPRSGEISYGLSSISGMGESTAEAIQGVEGRNDIDSFPGAVLALTGAGVSKRAIDAMIVAGAFDELGSSRRSMLLAYTELSEGNAQPVLPDEYHEVPLVGELPEFGKLMMERACLGSFASGHPLAGIRELGRDTIAGLGEGDDQVTLIGIVVSQETKTAKSGRPWSKIVLDDSTGELELSMFGKAHAGMADLLRPGAVVRAHVKLEDSGGVLLRAEPLELREVL